MKVSPKAGKPADPAILIDVPKLMDAYYAGRPDPSVPAQREAFGTSGHRGCSLDNFFNEAHILAITQAICLNRKQQRIDGPLYIGFDTHALSAQAFKSALEVPSRPSGTESVYKIYAESFKDRHHLDAIIGEAQEIVKVELESSGRDHGRR